MDNNLLHAFGSLKIANDQGERAQIAQGQIENSPNYPKPKRVRRKRKVAKFDTQPTVLVAAQESHQSDASLCTGSGKQVASRQQDSTSASDATHGKGGDDVSIQPMDDFRPRQNGAKDQGSSRHSRPPPNHRQPVPVANHERDFQLPTRELSIRTKTSPLASDAKSSLPSKLVEQAIIRPTPSKLYLEKAHEAPTKSQSENPALLVILDLNGTLLYRPQKGGSNAIHRSGMKRFINYLCKEHYVMVWSSAQPENVKNMCKKLFTKDQKQNVIAIWHRHNFGLKREHLYKKVQVYKELWKVWKEPSMARSKNTKGSWDQTNTVLLDDSREKAASEPFNLIEVDSFEGTEKGHIDTLTQVRDYLETLRSQANVSAYIREAPYVYDPERQKDITHNDSLSPASLVGEEG